MYFKGLTFIFSEDPPENHLTVIGGFLLKYYVSLLLLLLLVLAIPFQTGAADLHQERRTLC